MVRRRPVRVVCFGNRWQGDDGFGAHIFERLPAEWTRSPLARFAEAGTAGLSALALFEDCEKAVIVDALRTGARTGSVHRLDPTNVALDRGRLSLHSMGVGEIVAALPVVFGSEAPHDVVLIGADVGEIRPFTDDLSPPLRAALPTVINLIGRECNLPPRGDREARPSRRKPRRWRQ